MSDETVHWISDAPTSLHGNGAGSFDRTTRDEREVTCKLCLYLLARSERLPSTGEGDREALRKAITPVVNQGLDDYKMGRASNDALTRRLVDAVVGLPESDLMRLADSIWENVQVCVPGGCTHDDTGRCIGHVADLIAAAAGFRRPATGDTLTDTERELLFRAGDHSPEARIQETARVAINSVYGTDDRHAYMGLRIAQAVIDGAALPWKYDPPALTTEPQP